MGIGRTRTNGDIYSAIKELTRCTKSSANSNAQGGESTEAKQDEQIVILGNIITELIDQGLSLDNLEEIETLLTNIEGNNTANQAALDAIQAELEAQTLLLTKQGDFETLKQQADWTRVYTFLDPGADDERISTIVHSSAILGLTLTQTFVWAGTSPNFYLQSNTIA